jgi:Holliday junction resolvase
MTPKKRGGRSPKQRGDTYERELAAFISAHTGLEVSRAPLSGGGKVGLAGGADLIGTPGLFVEAKRVEKLAYREAMRQAETNIVKTRSPESPIVITRKNLEATEDSIVMLRLKDFIPFYLAHLTAQGFIRSSPNQTPAPAGGPGGLDTFP